MSLGQTLHLKLALKASPSFYELVCACLTWLGEEWVKRGRQRDKVFEESVDLKSIIKMLYLTSTSHIQRSDATTNDFREHKSGSRKVFFFFFRPTELRITLPHCGDAGTWSKKRCICFNLARTHIQKQEGATKNPQLPHSLDRDGGKTAFDLRPNKQFWPSPSSPSSKAGQDQRWWGVAEATKFELFIRDSHNAHSSTLVSPKVGQS